MADFRRELGLFDSVVVVAGGVIGVGIFANPSNVVRIVAAATLVVPTTVNAVGIRAGTWTNNVLMVAKVVGTLALMDGGNVVFPRLPSTIDGDRLAAHLLRRYSTAIVPGRMFAAPRHIRISFGCPPSLLDRGLRNLSHALDDLSHSRPARGRQADPTVLT